MSNPKITILMSVYNSEQFLRRAMESALAQTFRDFEFLIVNDGTTDSSIDIVREFDDKRIRIIKNERNLGLTASLNRGINESKGEFIARFDTDDMMTPRRIEVQYNYMRENPECGVCASLADIIDENDQVVRRTNFPARQKAIMWSLLFVNPITHSSAMVRTELLKKNPYDEYFKKSQDFELWTRLIFKTEFAIIQERLVSQRRHSGTISATAGSDQLQFAIEAARRYIRNLFGSDFVFDGFEIFRDERLWQFPQIYAARQFIERAYKLFMKKFDPNSHEKAEINREYGVRLGALAMKNMASPGAWPMILSILMKRPQIIFDYLKY
ncbi:MAG: glycosyltransferase family 2 protein [Candidatus Kapaibacterium sp.]